MSTPTPGAFIICDEELDNRLATAKELRITTAQILAPPASARTKIGAEQLLQKFQSAGVTITVVFCGFAGESYADIPTVKETVGLVPKNTRAERLQEARQIFDFAALLGVPVVGLHIGFIAEDETDADYQAVLEVARQLCDYAAQRGLRVHLETGQETAPTLLRFLQHVDRSNLAVNFDPANMILYGSGEPIPALKMVAAYIKSVHCKDATWAAKPGLEWGEEVPLGDGDVNMALFLETLHDIGYNGPLTIEREISGEAQAKDIKKGLDLLQKLIDKIWQSSV